MKSSENKEKIALPELLRKRKPIIHFSDDSDNSEDIEKIAESYVVFEKTGETIYNFPEKKSLESYILVEWKGYNDEGLFDGLALALVNLVEIHNAIEISKGTNIQCPDFQLSSKSKVLSEYFKYANYVVVSKPTKVEVDSFGTVLRSNLEFYCALTADDIALLINNDEVTPDTSLSNIATDKFDSFVEIFSKLSAEKQKITYHELSDKLEDSQKTTLLKDASFDIMDVIDEEEGYISHWELIENSRYFSDNNKLLEFAQQMACSSLPETDWDEQKDTFLESILNNLGINLDKQRRRKIHDKISGEISQLKMEKQRGHAEIQSSSRVVIRESGINISGELTFERGSLIYDTYLAAVKKVSQNKYWKFEDTTASVKITHPHNTYFIVDIVLTHPLWQKVRESYSRISDSHNLERILYSGEHEKIAQEISEILQRTSAHDLNTLRENISPISITEKVHSLCISYEQGKVYYFAEDTSICIDFRENADNQSFNLYNINVANDSSEKVFSQLIISGFLKWDVDKVNEDVNSFEREAAGALVGMQKNRMLSKYEDSKRYKQLCYYQVELANGRIPQLLDIQHDISLIRQVNNKSVLFNDAYEKLVEYYKNLERENGSDVLNQSPSNSVIQNIL